jgi:hypothetical protein
MEIKVKNMEKKMEITANDMASRFKRLPQSLRYKVLAFIDELERQSGISEKTKKQKVFAESLNNIWEKMKNEDPDEIEAVIKEACENTL